jgi:hypothetical protein
MPDSCKKLGGNRGGGLSSQRISKPVWKNEKFNITLFTKREILKYGRNAI